MAPTTKSRRWNIFDYIYVTANRKQKCNTYMKDKKKFKIVDLKQTKLQYLY